MKTKFERLVGNVIHSFGGAICAVAILLPGTRATAQIMTKDLIVSVVGNVGSNYIYEYTPDGVRSTIASGLHDPLSLAFSGPGGDLFDGDGSSGTIYKFTPAGAQSVFATGLSEPLGLAFDSAGNLHEADSFSGNIYKFTTGGMRSTFASGLNDPQALAFQRVIFLTPWIPPPTGGPPAGVPTITLSWVANATGFNLVSANSLLQPVVWNTNTPSPVLTNGQNVVTILVTGAQMFFRLMH